MARVREFIYKIWHQRTQPKYIKNIEEKNLMRGHYALIIGLLASCVKTV